MQSDSARSNLASGCPSDFGEHDLYCAFTLPNPIDSVIALELVLDVQLAGSPLPPWWHLEPKGCRERNLIASARFPDRAACVDFWQGEATADRPASYTVGESPGHANQARIVVALAVLSTQYRRLEASQMYYAARLILRHGASSLCPGCGVPACIVLNSILVGRLPGAAGGDVYLEMPGANLANRVTWQGAGADCDAVPVKPRTWGALKTLYR